MVGGLRTVLSFLSIVLFPVFSLDESFSGLSYNGGKIKTKPVKVSLLWFGPSWHISGQVAIRDAITSLTSSQYPVKDSEVPTLRDWWRIVRQYGDSSNTPVTDRIEIGSECFYTGPQVNLIREQVLDIVPSVFNQSLIDSSGGNLTCDRAFEVNGSSIYLTLFSQRVMFLDGKNQAELMSSCSGNILLEVSAGVNVSMTWARAPQRIIDQCSIFLRGTSYLGPPNGNPRIDSVVGYALSKIADEVTNQDGRGWISNDGNSLTYIWDQNVKIRALVPSETCDIDAMVWFTKPRGYFSQGIAVNHTKGLHPYPPKQRCSWISGNPAAKFISFTINYLSVTDNSDDYLQICCSGTSAGKCTFFQSNNASLLTTFKVMSSTASITFSSGDYVPFQSRGWELSYSAGFCYGMRDFYERDGNIGYRASSDSTYVDGISCRWILHGKPGIPVSLNFTYINISKGLDFIAIYNAKKQQVANFSGYYFGSELPQINLNGEIMVAFSTQTDRGEGWLANFHFAAPLDNSRRVLHTILFILLAVVTVGVFLAFFFLVLHRRRKRYVNEIASEEELTLIRLGPNPLMNQIGEGPSAVTYREVSADGKSVAVKCIRDATSGSDLEEEILLKSTSHPKIISLVGYANDGLQRRYLVFEFMDGGNLSVNLKEKGVTLDYKCCRYSKPAIYHGNIASENILLADSCNAKLGGFGAANYCRNGRMNPHHLPEMDEDIWSFGIVLIELLRGEFAEDREAYKNFTTLEEINELVGVLESFDPRLGIPTVRCKVVALAKLGDVAKWCLCSGCRDQEAKTNPLICDILTVLKQVKILFSSVQGLED